MWDGARLQAVGGFGEYSSSQARLLKIVHSIREGLQMETCLLCFTSFGYITFS